MAGGFEIGIGGGEVFLEGAVHAGIPDRLAGGQQAGEEDEAGEFHGALEMGSLPIWRPKVLVAGS